MENKLFKKQDFKIKAFLLNNIISSFLTISWFSNKINTKTHLLLELLLLSFKLPIEYYTNNLSIDIIFHHLCMIIGSSLVFNKQFSTYSNIISVMQIIHIPLTSYYSHKLLKLKKKNFKYFNNLYLLTWLPCSIYRNSYLIKTTYENIYNNNFNHSLLLLLFSLGFTYLDYKWTPWKKYKKICKSLYTF